MEIHVEPEKARVLESLLNEARAEADELRGRVDTLERILLSTRLIMGHELKKPTTAITGYLDLALDEAEEQKLIAISENVRKARDECDLLNDLNLFFLELLKINARPDMRCGGEISIRGFVKETVRHIPKHLNPEKRVRTRISPDIQKFRLHPNAFKIIVGNLVENALAYSSANSPVLVAISRDHDKRGISGRNLLMVRVIDKGVGIPKDYLKNIFQPFVRLNEEVAEGSGLGLTLVRSLVELNGGNIYIKSENGKGTTVHVTLPELLPGEEEAGEL